MTLSAVFDSTDRMVYYDFVVAQASCARWSPIMPSKNTLTEKTRPGNPSVEHGMPDKASAKREHQLMLRLREPSLPPTDRARYEELLAKRHDRGVTDQERLELISFSNRVELFSARQVEWLIELARLRHKSLPEMTLEIFPERALNAERF